MRSGSQVEVHSTILPEAAGTSARSTTSSTCSVLNTASTIGSQCCAISASEAARPPISASFLVRAGSTSKPSTEKPAATRRRAYTSPIRPTPMRPTGCCCGTDCSLGQRRDVQLVRQRVEAFAQRFWYRHAVLAALQILGVALLARQEDALDAG